VNDQLKASAFGLVARERARFARFRTLWREPLVHFALAGLALFLLFRVVSPGDVSSNRIVISRQQMGDFVSQFEADFDRPPTAAELSGIVDRSVHDEIIYREGLAIGLADDDSVIKRRVRQKYDLMAEEGDSLSAPSDADLAAYLKAHPDKFRRPAMLSFDQIFFDPALNTPEAVTAVKNSLRADSDVGGLGQPSLLPRRVERMAGDLIAGQFGEDFASQIDTLPMGEWSGPIASGLGVHLVRVTQRIAPAVPPLGVIRDQVAREWENARRAQVRDADYTKIRARYDVVMPDGWRDAAR
jgi:parvulin-like peptidyl-prolyl cis-trans isomerase-like protein